MPTLTVLWQDVRESFDPDTNGVLPDLTIDNTGVADWAAVLDLVLTQAWRWDYCDPAGDLPRSVETFMQDGVTLKVWPRPGFQVNIFPTTPEMILMDVDLRELQGQQRLDMLCDFLSLLGRQLRKPVVMTPEGHDNPPLLRFDVAADAVLLAATARPVG